MHKETISTHHLWAKMAVAASGAAFCVYLTDGRMLSALPLWAYVAAAALILGTVAVAKSKRDWSVPSAVAQVAAFGLVATSGLLLYLNEISKTAGEKFALDTAFVVAHATPLVGWALMLGLPALAFVMTSLCPRKA